MITTESQKIVQAVAAFHAQKMHIFEIKDSALVFVIRANLRKDFASQFSNKKKNPKQGQRSNTKNSCNTIHDQLRKCFGENNSTSSNRSKTRLIWAPTGDFLMVAICWSFSVSFVKEYRCANGTSCVAGGGGVGGFRDDGPALAAGCGRGAVFARLACSFSCCLLNCASFCASAIATKSFDPQNKTKNTAKTLILPPLLNLFCLLQRS